MRQPELPATRAPRRVTYPASRLSWTDDQGEIIVVQFGERSIDESWPWWHPWQRPRVIGYDNPPETATSPWSSRTWV